jgi:FtsH-binding integral membrane protein
MEYMIAQIKHLTKKFAPYLLSFAILGLFLFVAGHAQAQSNSTVRVDTGILGFDPARLTLGRILSWAIKLFFIIAGLTALFFLLLGALAWITSGGDKDNVEKARSKLTAAVIGVVLIVVVLAIIVTLEQVVFASKICFGLSCDINLPSIF